MSQYDIEPIEYKMKPLDVNSTYDQFANLRDTLVFSWNKYAGKGWCLLCVWEKEETIEILWRNVFQQNFESITWGTPVQTILWPYITRDANIASNYWILSCVIQKSWRYRILHKEEILLQPWTKKVFCYVDIYRPDWQWWYTMPYPGWVAVFDWEWEFSKTYTWSTSWTEPNGSCSVTVSFKLWDIIQKMTASWYMERNLLKGDVLVLRAKDAANPDGTPAWNDLILQPNSNYWSIEYLNLPIN